VITKSQGMSRKSLLRQYEPVLENKVL